MKKELLYRIVPHNGGAVFATPERAALIARIHEAINGSETWGDFRAAMPRKEYSWVIRAAFDDNGEPRPRSTDAFSGEDVPGWSDGDYPPWLQPEMDRLLPHSLLVQFGTRESTWLNGNFWRIPGDSLPALCAALIALGWELRHAPDLQFH